MSDEANQNRFSLGFVSELRAKLDTLAGDKAAKVCILSGLEEVFCAGGDKEVLLGLAEGRIEPYDLELTRQLIELPIPTVAAMAGHAIGGGFVFGLACDMVVMGKQSRYGCNFMDMGFTPGMGTTRLLQAAFGDYLAAEMMFGAKYFKGKKLQDRALVNAIVDRDEVETRAEEIAGRIADKPRKAITLLKRSLAFKKRRLFEEARTVESYMHEICFADPETQARIKENYNDR
jgi:polyketide biosynthesis enoyl-CoA hydratase PksI